MEIKYTGHNVHVTDEMRDFTAEKLERLKHHYDRILGIDVTFDVEKLRHIAKANVFVSKDTIHASSETEDMYKSVDELVDKLSHLFYFEV